MSLFYLYKDKGNNTSLKVGDKIPSFKLYNQNGELYDIDSVIGEKKIVIFFYPKDFTAVCTKEACSFRDHYGKFKEMGAEIIGISGQSIESKKDFASRYNLSYVLLSDEKNAVRDLFGVPKGIGGIPGRVTYVIDKKGIIRNIFNSSFEAQAHIDNSMRALVEIND